MRPSFSRHLIDTITQRPLAFGLVLAIAVLAVVRVMPGALPWNLAPLGAMALFAAARLGGALAWVLPIGVRLITDLILWEQYHRVYPIFDLFVYACLVMYIMLGFLLRRTENPLAIGGAALLGSSLFFLVTNFGSWLAHAMNYPMTFDGLMQSYVAALPYHRSTLASDLIFTGILFGAHAALSRVYFPAERVAPQPGVNR